MRALILLNILFSVILCQKHLDILINDVLSGSKDSAVIYLPLIEEKYPHNPNMLFLKALMETNGEEAKKIFLELYNNHPTSPYADDALMKVSEYYYASGLYVQSAEWLKKMPRYYSRSEHIERAIKLFLNSLIVSGHRDTAIFYSRVFKKQFPFLDVNGKINDLLEDYEKSKLSSKDSINYNLDSNHKVFNPSPRSHDIKINKYKGSGAYSLQSGAFSLQANAENQKKYLFDSGYNATIHEIHHQRKVLYAVRIGNYNTAKDAEEIGAQIKIKLDVDTIVIIIK